MSYDQLQNLIASTEQAIARLKAASKKRPSYDELLAERKRLRKALKLAPHDHPDRAELRRIELLLADIDAEVAKLQGVIDGYREHMSEAARQERYTSAIEAGESMQQRLTEELPKATDAMLLAMMKMQEACAELRRIATANSRDFGELARVALEDSNIEDAVQRLTERTQRPLQLRLDAVLPHWLIRCGLHNTDFVDVNRPDGDGPGLEGQLEYYRDGLAQTVHGLMQQVSVMQDAQEED